jgi:L-threonylcarbamoyladenylate synthase
MYWQKQDTKQKIITALQHDDVLVTTTDTIPGLLANITESGFTALNKIKQDRSTKPYIILISDLDKLGYFVDPLTPKIKLLLSKCWPGPLTVIFKAKHDLPYFLKSEKGTVAIRCPNYSPLLDILKHFNGLFSTSANRSAHPTPQKIEYLDPKIIEQVKYVVRDVESTLPTNPSTIIDISSGKIALVRQGAYPLEEIEKIWERE